MSDTPNKPENKKENFYDDTSDMRKSLRKTYKARRKKEKEVLDNLVNEDEDIEDFYDNFEKW